MTPVSGLTNRRIRSNSTCDLGVVERGGRLVHDQDLGVERQRLGDLDHLLPGHGEAADELPRVERQVQPVEQLLRPRVQRALVEEEARRCAARGR